MKIDVFFDFYPHPSKPYFEAQLTEWRRSGHTLRIFSLGQIPRATSEFPIPFVPIPFLPIPFVHTLRQAPLRLISKILWQALANPAHSWRIVRSESRMLPMLKRLATDSQLPTNPSDLHFVHNLATAVHFSYLRRAAPPTTLAIYYPGGNIPGIKQISLEDSDRPRSDWQTSHIRTRRPSQCRGP